MREIVISKNDGGQRLDKFLTKSFPNLPQSMLYKCIRKKDIKRNGKRCQASDQLDAGDVLRIYLKDEFFQRKPEQYDFLKAPNRLERIYEDKDMMVLDKKPGLIVHPDQSYHFDSLIARIQRYLYETKQYDPKGEQSFTPALVNRIDRNTGGLVMAAKNAQALRILNDKMRGREIRKFYLCIVCGHLSQKEGILKGYLEKNQDQNRVYISRKEGENRKKIRTKYRVLAEKKEFSLVEVELLTGRTHQIRAHFASIGHPLAGDGKYGTNAVNKKLQLRYQALYSYKLIFDFQTEAGVLCHLKGKVLEAKEIWLLDFFEGLPD